MQRAGAERLGAKLVAATRVQVEFDGVAVENGVVFANMSRLLIQAAQADVENFVVPEVQELAAPVGEIRVPDVHRRNESSCPVVELTIEGNRLPDLRYQTDDGLVLSAHDPGGDQEGTRRSCWLIAHFASC